MKKYYFDFAAATPTEQRVVEAMQPYFYDLFYNPSAVYLSARNAKHDLNTFRADVAHWLGARPSEITFTAGATEANNLAIAGVMGQYPDAHMLISAAEHESVKTVAEQHNTGTIPVDEYGQVIPETLKNHIRADTVLISIIYANNEIGTVQNLRELTEVVEEVRAERKQAGNNLPLLFHTDASQAINYLDLHVNKIGVDLMTLSGSKIYGPKQSGALYIRAGIVLSPLIYGGGQEHGLRSGTENLAQIAGFVRAMSIAQGMRKDEIYRLGKLRQLFTQKISQLDYDITLLGHKKQVLPNIISILVPQLDGERAVMALDDRGIECATGSACSALSDESSHVVKALGFTEEEAKGTLRFSMGRQTDDVAVQAALTALEEVLNLTNSWTHA